MKNLFFFSLLVALLMSCDKEADKASLSSSYVSFYPSSTLTRATDVTFEKGDAIGVFAVLREGNGSSPLLSSGNYADNKKYIYDGVKFSPANDANKIIITSYPIDYYAYYPYSATLTDALNHRFSVSSNQLRTTDSDLMYAKNTSGTGKNNIPLVFTHKLAKVVVPYKVSDVGSGVESAVLNNAFLSGHLNLFTGDFVTLSSAKADLTMHKETGVSPVRFVAILPPQSFSAGQSFISFSNSKKFKLSATQNFSSGVVTELPYMERVLEYRFLVSPSSKAVAALGEVFDMAITSQKYYSVDSTPLPDTYTNHPFSVSSNVSWISYNASTKKVTVLENKDVSSIRTGELLCVQDDSGKQVAVKITQAAAASSYGEWKVTLSASPLMLAAGGGTSTLSWSAERDILVNGTVTGRETATPVISGGGAGFSRTGNTVTAANNTSSASRSATYTASHAGKSASVTITQSAGNTTTDYSAWSTTSLTLSASPNPVASSGGSSALSCSAAQSRTKTVKWNGVAVSTSTETQTVSVTAAWGKVSGAGSLSGHTVTFDNNASTSVRSGVYRASYGGKTADITVSQSAGSTSTDYSAWSTTSLTLSASPNPVASSGGSSALSCSAAQSRTKTVKWNGVAVSTSTETQTVSVTAAWGKVSGAGSLSGHTVTFDNNASTSVRSGVYRASYGGKTADITVSQSAGTESYSYVFTINGGSSTSWTNIVSTGDTRTFTIVSQRLVFINGVQVRVENSSYSSSSNVGWASASGSTVTVADNPNAAPRGGVITFTQAGTGSQVKLTLLQLKKSSIIID